MIFYNLNEQIVSMMVIGDGENFNTTELTKGKSIILIFRKEILQVIKFITEKFRLYPELTMKLHVRLTLSADEID